VEAIKDRKTYERLREKAYDDYVEDEKRDEGIVNDEHNSYVYGLMKEG
jgi:flagellar biosynthesis chaperone FliJ